MKYSLRIPTSEQYAYIECEYEGDAEDAVEEYNRLTRLVRAPGVPVADFRRCLDEFLSTGTVIDGGDLWENMSEYQKGVFGEIKRSRARTNK